LLQEKESYQTKDSILVRIELGEKKMIRGIKVHNIIGKSPRRGDAVDDFGMQGVINTVSKGYTYVAFEEHKGTFDPIAVKDLFPSSDRKNWITKIGS
jgi:hypothetical protein